MPLFVVKNQNTSYLSGKAAGLLDDSLDADYALVEIIDGRHIYRRMRK